jgi:cytidine deaminase
MMEQAVAVRKKTYAPYSKFRVVALLLDNGQTVLGSNQEKRCISFRPLCRTCSYFQEAIYPEAKILKWLLPQLPTPIKQ